MQYRSRVERVTWAVGGPYAIAATYGGKGAGNMTLHTATLKSDNSVYAQLTSDLGPDKVKETARMMGIKSKLLGVCAETLGGLTDGVSPLEMARPRRRDALAYARSVPTTGRLREE